MIYLHLKSKFFISILTILALVGSGVMSWKYWLQHKQKVLSDQQIVWLLVGLLIFAIMSMGTFLLILLGGTYTWHYLQI
jgi:hypothetical protein